MRPVAVLTVLVDAQTAQAASSLGKFQGTLKATTAESQALSARMASAGAGLSKFGSAWNKSVALPVAALGGLAVKSSVDFNHAMTQVFTQAGSAKSEIGNLRNQVLDLSKTSIFGPTDLANALFHVESVGFRGAKAMNVLNAAQKAATVGNSDLESTTYALVSALETGIQGTGNLGKAIALMDSIVGHGDLRMEDFTAALSSGVLPAAKTFGLSLRDVGAALDTMTARGMPAQLAATRLRMTFSLLGAQTDTATKELETIGIKQGQLGEVMQHKGLIPAVALLSTKLKQSGLDAAQQADVISRAFGGGRSGAAIMTLVQNVDDLRSRYHSLSSDQTLFNRKLKAAQETDMNKLKTAWSSIQVSLVQIGDALVPVVVPAFQDIAKFTEKIATGFDSLSPSMKSVVVDAAMIAVSLGFAAKALGGMLKFGGAIAGSKLLFGAGGLTGAAPVAAAGEQLALPLGGAAATSRLGGLAGLAGRFGGTATGGLGSIAGLGEGAAAGVGAAAGGAALAGGINVLSSALSGDWEQVGAKGGGAIIGGILGAFGGPAGAALGAGIGSFVGGAMDDAVHSIFGGDSGPGGLSKKLQDTAAALSSAQAREAHSSRALARSAKDVVDSRHKQADAADRLKKAQAHLAEVQKKEPNNEHAIMRAVLAVKQARLADVRATHAQQRAQQVHGRLEEAEKQNLRGLVAAEKGRILALRDLTQRYWHQFKQAQKNLRQDHQEHALGSVLEADRKKLAAAGSRYERSQSNLASEQSKLNQAYSKATSEIGPKYAAMLRHVSSLTGGFVHPAKTAMGAVARLNNQFQQQQQQLFGLQPVLEVRMPKALGKTGDSTGKLQRAIKAFQQQGTNSIFSLANATGSGMGAMSQDFNQVTGPLNNAPKLHFHAVSPHGHARGGLMGVVPGIAAGDKHMLTLDGKPIGRVESKEGIFVGNRSLMDHMKFANGMFPRYARGGEVDVLPGVNMSMGSEPTILRDLRRLSSELHKTVYVISGYRSPAHSVAVGGFANDPHTQGAAADIGVGSPSLASMFGVSEHELNAVGLYRPFYPQDPHEVNHVQLLSGGAKGGLVSQAMDLVKKVALHGPEGLLRTAGQGTLNRARGELNKWINAHQPSGLLGGNVPTGPVVEMAKKMVAQVFGMGQWSPFQSLEMQEAGFNPRAQNPSSGAAGLAQALPPSKYPPGAWPYTGPQSSKLQLQWMMGYIRSRYGNPAGAWAHEQSAGWYQRGGLPWAGWFGNEGAVSTSRPTLLGIGDGHGRETAVVTRGGSKAPVKTPNVYVYPRNFISGDIGPFMDDVRHEIDVAFDERDDHEAVLGKAGM